MTESAQPIQLPVSTVSPNTVVRLASLATIALSPDGRRLVTAVVGRPAVNVADLDARRSWSVTIADATTVTDVSFSHGPSNHGLLALNVVRPPDPSAPTRPPWPGNRYQVLVGELQGEDLVELGTGQAVVAYSGLAALEWTSDGAGILAAVDWPGPSANEPPKRPLVYSLNVEDGGRRLSKTSDLSPCSDAAFVLEILTGNGYMPTATTTPTPSVSPSPIPSATSTPTPNLSPTPTAMATATRQPVAIFLPLTLREHCSPEYVRSDIALVIDTSSSMTGQKIEDARNGALSFVDLIDLAPGRSQVAVVRFDREAEVVRELTNARALIEAAVRNLQVRSGTHIDKGLRTALAELQSLRHSDRNAPVLMLLTDGVQTGTPGEELRAAAEVRAAGVRVYTIGLGADVDDATLRSIAGDRERYFFAPDSGDLANIYGEIARDLMCPGADLWDGR
jgi:Mg-chelatase subunit ChlD